MSSSGAGQQGVVDYEALDDEPLVDEARRLDKGLNDAVDESVEHDPANVDEDRVVADPTRDMDRTQGIPDMDIVLKRVEERRTEREKALSAGKRVAAWKCVRRLLCGNDTLLLALYGGRYWRSTEQLYREYAELEAVRVVMVEGTSQAVAGLLQCFDERLEKDTKVGEDYKKIVITSIFLAEWLREKIQRAKVRCGQPAAASESIRYIILSSF